MRVSERPVRETQGAQGHPGESRQADQPHLKPQGQVEAVQAPGGPDFEAFALGVEGRKGEGRALTVAQQRMLDDRFLGGGIGQETAQHVNVPSVVHEGARALHGVGGDGRAREALKEEDSGPQEGQEGKDQERGAPDSSPGGRLVEIVQPHRGHQTDSEGHPHGPSHGQHEGQTDGYQSQKEQGAAIAPGSIVDELVDDEEQREGQNNALQAGQPDEADPHGQIDSPEKFQDVLDADHEPGEHEERQKYPQYSLRVDEVGDQKKHQVVERVADVAEDQRQGVAVHQPDDGR